MAEFSMDHRKLHCERCAAMIVRGQGESYLVKIHAVADPTPAVITAEELASDVRSEIQALLNQIRDLSEKALIDQVYRRELLFLCGPCYRSWIKNPVGR